MASVPVPGQLALSAAPPAPVASAVVRIHGRDVRVTAAAAHLRESDVARAVACVPFVDWAERMDARLVVHSIALSDVDYFGHRVGFLKFTAHVTKDGVALPGIVFMRGGAVAVLPLLRCDGERFVLCCRQPRVPCGVADFLEIPAGMLDGSGHFSGVAAKEMQEETGLDIGADELVDLTALAFGCGGGGDGGSGGGSGDGGDAASALAAPSPQPPLRGVYPSVGACDEFVRLLYYRRDVTRAELEALRGKATGCLHEGELITLEVVPYDELWRRAPDAKTLAAMLLLERLAARGLVDM